MPIQTKGSSGISAERREITPEVQDKLESLSADEPLPSEYGRDSIRLLPQSPWRLYAYWEFARDPFDTLRRSFGSRANDFSLVIRLVHVASNTATVHEAGPARNYWFDVQPDTAYRSEVGFYASGGLFVRLLSSADVRTPRARVSPRVDPSPEFKVRPDEFAKVLEQAGFLVDALEVSLEAADEVSAFEASRLIASHLGDGNSPELTEDELAELRGILAALAMGADIRDFPSRFSEAIARWLAELQRQNADLSQANVLGMLNSLGIRTSSGLEPLQVDQPAHTVVGASEVNLPSPPVRMWLTGIPPGRPSSPGGPSSSNKS
jgi:hypothetical protein